ncbi:MAG TPA: MarR family transcriptional regulator, partial [Candidatus Latescibacteria bacterium]|nr:MarR family transcriptional regulator [Candidatus Latescibacterota bacterium]
MSGLSKEFGLTQATVSDAVRSLVEKGLVSRSPCWEDGRVQVLGLTSSGRELTKRISDWQVPIIEQIEAFPYE